MWDLELTSSGFEALYGGAASVCDKNVCRGGVLTELGRVSGKGAGPATGGMLRGMITIMKLPSANGRFGVEAFDVLVSRNQEDEGGVKFFLGCSNSNIFPLCGNEGGG